MCNHRRIRTVECVGSLDKRKARGGQLDDWHGKTLVPSTQRAMAHAGTRIPDALPVGACRASWESATIR